MSYTYEEYKIWAGKNKDKRKIIAQRWKKNHPEYFIKNREINKIKRREYYLKNRHKFSKYYYKNKKRINENTRLYLKNKRKLDPIYRVKINLRRRLHNFIKGKDKTYKTLELLGCSMDELKLYIESKFTDGMSWENYGLYGWHIDHIIPCSKFNFSNEEEQKKCFHFTNLQPLWAKDNIIKGNNLLS